MLHPCCMQRPSKIAAAHTEQPAGSWCLSWLAPEGGFGVGEAVDQDTNGLALLRLVFTVPHFRSRVLLRGGGVNSIFMAARRARATRRMEAPSSLVHLVASLSPAIRTKLEELDLAGVWCDNDSF